MSRAIDLTGQRFSRLTVTLKAVDGGKVAWECICDCGSKVIVPSGSLKSGNTRSCGCLRNERMAAAVALKPSHLTHGLSNSPEYNVWCQIKSRCYNEKHPQFKDYGGRGIRMCDEWVDSFETFYRDLGPRPSSHHSIERGKNDEGYSKANCYWATRTEQNNNRRNTVRYAFKGEEKSLSQWCLEEGVNYQTVRSRLGKGMSFHEAMVSKAKRKKDG